MVTGSGAGAGAGAHLGGGPGKRGAQRSGAIVSESIQEPRERSASAPQVRMRCDAKTANGACERQIANE
eukprot:1328585-Pleurochrysis_carterae.AAC.1